MAFTLVPFPISIIFVIVFALVFFGVLWKLRARGKVYNALFRLTAVIGLGLFAVLIYSMIH